MEVVEPVTELTGELDEAESRLQNGDFEGSSSAARSLLQKLVVFPGGERYEAAAACVLIQAYCNQDR